MKQLPQGPTSEKAPKATRWSRFKKAAGKAASMLMIGTTLPLLMGTSERGCRLYQDFWQPIHEVQVLGKTCNEIRSSGTIQSEFSRYPSNFQSNLTKANLVPQMIPLSMLNSMDLSESTRNSILEWRHLNGALATMKDGSYQMELYFDTSKGTVNQSTIHHEMAHLAWFLMSEEDRTGLRAILDSQTSLVKTNRFIMDRYIHERFLRFQIECLTIIIQLHKETLRASKNITLKFEEGAALLEKINSMVNSELKRDPSGASARRLLKKTEPIVTRLDEIEKTSKEVSKLDKLVDAIPSNERWGTVSKSKDMQKYINLMAEVATKLRAVSKKIKESDILLTEFGIKPVGADKVEELIAGIKETYYEEMFARAVQATFEGNPPSSEFVRFISSLEINGEQVYRTTDSEEISHGVNVPIICLFGDK